MQNILKWRGRIVLWNWRGKNSWDKYKKRVEKELNKKTESDRIARRRFIWKSVSCKEAVQIK